MAHQRRGPQLAAIGLGDHLERRVAAQLIEGGRGEFTVWVDDAIVAEKSAAGFPGDDEVLAAVRSVTRSR